MLLFFGLNKQRIRYRILKQHHFLDTMLKKRAHEPVCDDVSFHQLAFHCVVFHVTTAN